MRKSDCFVVAEFIPRIIAGLLLAMTLLASFAFAEDIDDAETKARAAHELAGSDVIYEQENFKALYYQNAAMIQLLKEIREELHMLNIRAAKEEKA